MDFDEQRRTCPICSGVMTLRGLYGHLRMKHNKQGEELKSLVGRATVAESNANEADDTEETFRLIDQLQYLWERDEAIDELFRQGCFNDDEMKVSLQRALQSEAADVCAALAKRGINITDDALAAICTVKRAVTSQGEVREEGV